MKRGYITKEEKEKKVAELLKKGANIREISKRVHMSFSDIGKITRKIYGDPEQTVNLKKLSKHSQALELFRTNHSSLDVAIKVGLTDSETEEAQKQYRRLINMDKFCDLYDNMKGDLEGFLQLNAELNCANIGIADAIEGLGYARSMASMKLEHANLQSKLKQIRNDSFLAWMDLQRLKEQVDYASKQLEYVKVMASESFNEENFSSPNNNNSVFRARRRRRIRKSSREFLNYGAAS